MLKKAASIDDHDQEETDKVIDIINKTGICKLYKYHRPNSAHPISGTIWGNTTEKSMNGLPNLGAEL